MATLTPNRRGDRRLSVRDPFSEFDSLFDRFNRWLGHSDDGASMVGDLAWAPSVDISEDERAYRITAEIPGVEKDDIDLDIHNGVLTLAGERRAEARSDEATWHRVERSYGRFTRSFGLPENVDEDGIDAAFANGLLTVTIPKAAENPPKARRIAVT